MKEKIKEVHEITRQVYNKIAHKYHDLFQNEMKEKEYDRKYVDDIITSLPENAIVCDAGCGPSAQIARFLNEKGINCMGVDISEKCIELARSFNPDIPFTCTDFLTWDIPPNSFDGIISYYSVIYTPKNDVHKVLSIFHAALKPQGKLLVVVKKGDFEGFQDEVIDIKVRSFFAEYSEDELAQLLGGSGFSIDKMDTRVPYNHEIDMARIYCVARKKE
ncbi:class I SAM-dependent DNA methyltransferase [Bacteroidota bacterium]